LIFDLCIFLDDLIKANKIRKLQFTSDIGSEIEENQVTLKRKRKCPKRLQSNSEEEEENNNCLQTKKLSTAILARPPPVQPLLPRSQPMQPEILPHHPLVV